MAEEEEEEEKKLGKEEAVIFFHPPDMELFAEKKKEGERAESPRSWIQNWEPKPKAQQNPKPCSMELQRFLFHEHENVPGSPRSGFSFHVAEMRREPQDPRIE